MSNRLPQIFLNKSAVFESPLAKKKQGGIFQLHLKDKQHEEMNSTFTAGYKDKHYKTSIHKKIIRDTQMNYRTIPLRVNQYEISREKRLLTSHFTQFRSAKVKSFSVDKNPQTCQGYHQSEQAENVNSIIANRRHELMDLEFKLTPFAFVTDEYRKDLQKVRLKIQGQILHVQKEFGQAIQHFRSMMAGLRKQTGNQQKKIKLDLDRYQEEILMFKEMAEDFPQKMDTIKNSIQS